MVFDRIRVLNKESKLIAKEIAKIQRGCPHQNASYTYKGNTGNYDPSCDRYWVEVKCKDCQKQWDMDQDDEFHNLERKNPQWKCVK
jgi:hypothetical protein